LQAFIEVVSFFDMSFGSFFLADLVCFDVKVVGILRDQALNIFYNMRVSIEMWGILVS